MLRCKLLGHRWRPAPALSWLWLHPIYSPRLHETWSRRYCLSLAARVCETCGTAELMEYDAEDRECSRILASVAQQDQALLRLIDGPAAPAGRTADQ